MREFIQWLNQPVTVPQGVMMFFYLTSVVGCSTLIAVLLH